jgi:hypothetical protein
MDETLGLVRLVAMTGVVTGVRSQQAEGLRAQRGTLMSQREGTVKAGQWNTWVVFGELCGEIAGSDRYESCEMLYIAATDRWREKVRPDGRPISMTGDEEVADDSPMAQMLRRTQPHLAEPRRVSGRDLVAVTSHRAFWWLAFRCMPSQGSRHHR